MRRPRTTLAVLLFCGLFSGKASSAQEHEALVYTVQAGAGGLRAWNLAGMTVEYFPRTERLGIFAAAGFGTILGGGGVALYQKRPGTGFFGSATLGLAGAHVQAGTQLPLSDRLSAVLGVSYGGYFLQYVGFLPVAGVEYRLQPKRRRKVRGRSALRGGSRASAAKDSLPAPPR